MKIKLTERPRKFHPKSFLVGIAVGAALATGTYHLGKGVGRVEANKDAPVRMARSFESLTKKANDTLTQIGMSAMTKGEIKVDDLRKFKDYTDQLKKNGEDLLDSLPDNHEMRKPLEIFLNKANAKSQ